MKRACEPDPGACWDECRFRGGAPAEERVHGGRADLLRVFVDAGCSGGGVAELESREAEACGHVRRFAQQAKHIENFK